MTRRAGLCIVAFVLPLMVLASPKAESAATAGLSKPTEATAIADVQKFLDLRTGRWTVHKFTKKAERSGQVNHRETYQMDGLLDVTIHTSGEPRRRDLENDPWMARLSGRAGERKTTPVTLTWVRTDSGWKLRRLE